MTNNNNNNNPEDYINQATKLENKKSFLEYFFQDITWDRYDKITELYTKAGNIYKLSDKIKAIQCYKKVLKYDQNEFNKNKILLNIAELYKIIDYNKSITYYEKIISNYEEKGELDKIIKYKEIIGDLYLSNNCIDKSLQIYSEILQTINFNSDNKNLNTKKKICEIICETLINTNNSIKILEASLIYFNLAKDFIKHQFLQHSSKKYIFLGLLSDCAADDFVKGKKDYLEFSNLDYTFSSSFEGNFINDIFNAVESNDSEKFNSLCLSMDNIKHLDNVQVNLLLKIKNIMECRFDNNIEEEEEMNFC